MYLVHLDMPNSKILPTDRLSIHVYSESTAIGSWFSLTQLRDMNYVEDQMTNLNNLVLAKQLEKLNQYPSVKVNNLEDLKVYVEVVYGANNK